MPQVLDTPWWKHVFVWQDSFVVMTSTIIVYVWTNFTTFLYCFVCYQSVIWQKNYKNSSACKFTFEVISWKLTDENHSWFLLVIGKQRGNKICKENNFVQFPFLYSSIFVSYYLGPLFLGHAVLGWEVSQILIGQGCAAGSSGPIPMFGGKFFQKKVHV